MDKFFTAENTWTGGNFELVLEIGLSTDPHADARLRQALSALCGHPALTGFYLNRYVEPEAQKQYSPDEVTLPLEQYPYGIAGIAHLPNGTMVPCCIWGGREVPENRDAIGSDWLSLSLPMGGLRRAYPIGAYPFEDGSSLAWCEVLQKWLIDIAERVYKEIPFELGLIDFDRDVYDDTRAEYIRRDGIPAKRWFGYLWPEGGQLRWYPPTEPFS